MAEDDALRARLQRWLHEHGRSARWLGVTACGSENMVQRYLTHATSNLRPENWQRIAAVIGVPPAIILAEAGYELAPEAPTDPASQIDLILQQAGVQEGARQALMWAVRQALAEVARPTSGVPQ